MGQLTHELLCESCGEKNVLAALIQLGFELWELEYVEKDPAKNTNKKGHKFCSYDPVTKGPFDNPVLLDKKIKVFNDSVAVKLGMVQDAIPQMHNADKCRLWALGNTRALDHKNRERLTKKANQIELDVAKEKALAAGKTEIELSGRQLHTAKKKEQNEKKFQQAVERGQKAIYDEVTGMVTTQVRATIAQEQKEASIARLKAFKAERKRGADEHSVAMAAKMARMKAEVVDADKRLWEHRMEVKVHIDSKMDRAAECVRKRNNWVNESDVKEKMQAAQAERDATMLAYKKKMAKRIHDMKAHSLAVGEKIAGQKQANHEALQQKILVKVGKFHRQRIEVQEHLAWRQQQREEKYQAHCEHLDTVRTTRSSGMQSKSDLAKDTRTKALTSAHSNHEMIKQQKNEKWKGLDAKFDRPTIQMAADMREAHIKEVKQMNQIYSALQRANMDRLARARNTAIANTLTKFSQIEAGQQEIQRMEAEQDHEKKMLMRSMYMKKEEYDVCLYKLKGETDKTKMQKRLNQLGMKFDISAIEKKVLGTTDEDDEKK